MHGATISGGRVWVGMTRGESRWFLTTTVVNGDGLISTFQQPNPRKIQIRFSNNSDEIQVNLGPIFIGDDFWSSRREPWWLGMVVGHASRQFKGVTLSRRRV
ncbi:hypothetical protein ACFX1Z_037327 [Malus domestica]